MNERNRNLPWSATASWISLVTLAAMPAIAPAHDEHAPHFDAAQHGGIVLEFHDEIHYEVALASGDGQQLQVWLGDAHRRPLAASEVTDLVAEVGHADKSIEPVDMHISEDGNSWTGSVHLKDPADLVRIGFTYHQATATGSVNYDTLLHPPKPEPQQHVHAAGGESPHT
jgi:hypothetical protein